ncbi:MAG: hypothetical protein AB1898_18700 [Acidobacteriota bacterium]
MSPIRSQKSLDRKLASIHQDPHRPGDFILADAKDADMAFGLPATGFVWEGGPGNGRPRTLAEFRDTMRQIVEQGLVDIMLMSASTSQELTIDQRIFDHSTVTPAVRANDSTDIHAVRGGHYLASPSLPFRTVTIDQIQSGKAVCTPDERQLGADLGLYSVTFNNLAEADRRALEAYREFRLEAEQKGFRHFLEVFNPNLPDAVPAERLADFINDHIARMLAGVPRAGRPIFLKIPYHGPRAMEALVTYDPHLVVGILGGSAGTSYDALKMLSEARKYGARAALFGRKINQAEDQLAFVEVLRAVADGQLSAEEGVKRYHAALEKKGIRPRRSLPDDMVLTQVPLS